MSEATNIHAEEVAVIIHRPTRVVNVSVGSMADMEAIMSSREVHGPATKVSVDNLSRVEVIDPGMDCPICLVEFRSTIVKEMPCKHQFCAKCIEKWLGIHCTCPVCRFNMPVEERKEDEVHEMQWGQWTIRLIIPAGARGEVTGVTEGVGIESPYMDVDNSDD